MLSGFRSKAVQSRPAATAARPWNGRGWRARLTYGLVRDQRANFRGFGVFDDAIGGVKLVTGG